jgi:hypothetical protein
MSMGHVAVSMQCRFGHFVCFNISECEGGEAVEIQSVQSLKVLLHRAFLFLFYSFAVQ